MPTSLSATAFSSSQITLSWSASTDAVGITGYRIYRDGTEFITTENMSYSDTELTAEITYSYTVSAYDAVGNVSTQSTSASATTGVFSTASPVLNFSDIESGPAELYTYQKMQTISFSIPAAASDGLNNIYVVVNGQNSEALQFVVRSGDIYFVKQSGTNGSTIDGAWNEPWAILDYVALGSNNLGAGGRFKPGDIVYATDGVIETDGLYVKSLLSGLK